MMMTTMTTMTMVMTIKAASTTHAERLIPIGHFLRGAIQQWQKSCWRNRRQGLCRQGGEEGATRGSTGSVREPGSEAEHMHGHCGEHVPGRRVLLSPTDQARRRSPARMPGESVPLIPARTAQGSVTSGSACRWLAACTAP